MRLVRGRQPAPGDQGVVEALRHGDAVGQGIAVVGTQLLEGNVGVAGVMHVDRVGPERHGVDELRAVAKVVGGERVEPGDAARLADAELRRERNQSRPVAARHIGRDEACRRQRLAPALALAVAQRKGIAGVDRDARDVEPAVIAARNAAAMQGRARECALGHAARLSLLKNLSGHGIGLPTKATVDDVR